MSGLWNTPGIPHTGWVCINVIDLEPEDESEYGSCKMCGKEKIRYVHSMEHDDYPDGLDVGCVCAIKMTGDKVNPKLQEKKLRNRANRKNKWLKRKWRTSAIGNHYINADGHNIGVLPNKFNEGQWNYRIDGNFSRKMFNSQPEAKLALFDEFWKILQREEEDDYSPYLFQRSGK